ncbi:sufe-like protein 2 chloroplastic [Phtheirospermum japonicum]|uniref:Sufe-like protein 2 chloroplastic n=1 Tax=Phtheirospermum japonicum TaxID=374723 RepID=A0A830CMQ5_9LAMI|nr:sufe-like protein 2 chloroplastic [Phtheirospermum japonicum]
MVSFSARSFFSPPPPPSLLTKPENPNIKPNPIKPISRKNPPKILSTFLFNKNPNPQKTSLSCFTINQQQQPFTIQTSTVSQKVQSLDFEFKSLPDPIDRVKRLLHYATILPPFDDSLKTQENRVLGCTAQVWLEVKMDTNGFMGFRVDSDSEISKGFCSCLVWALDGAQAHEVLSVKTEDLLEMNVGLASRVSSRFNAWHNVLFSMQRRSKDLVEGKRVKCGQCLEDDVVSSFLGVDGYML